MSDNSDFNELELDGYKQTLIPKSTLEERNSMTYNLVDSLARQFPGMGKGEFRELVALTGTALYMQQNIVFTEKEINEGIKFALPINLLARLMGYNIVNEEGEKNTQYYKSIKKASGDLRGRTSVIELPDGGFHAYGPVNDILYNPRRDGKVYVNFSPRYSRMIFNKMEPSTVQSLLMFNMMDDEGGFAASRMYQYLCSYYKELEKSPTGSFEFYVDFCDLRANMDMIRVGDERLQKILNDERYKNYKNDPAVARDRMYAIHHLDDVAKKNIAAYRETFEYQHKNELPKDEKQRVVETMHNLYEQIVVKYELYSNFKMRVLDVAQKSMRAMYYNNKDLIRFQFEFEPVPYKGEYIGVNFTLYTMDAYLAKISNDKREIEKYRQLTLGEFDDEYNNVDVGPKKPNTFTSVTDEIKVAEKVDVMPEDKPYVTKKSIAEEAAKQVAEQFRVYYDSLPEMEREIYLSVYDIYNVAKEGDFETMKANYELLIDNIRSGKLKKTVINKKGEAVPNNLVAWFRSATRKNYAANVVKEEVSRVADTISANTSAPQEKKKSGNQFNNFAQNEHDFELMEILKVANRNNEEKVRELEHLKSERIRKGEKLESLKTIQNHIDELKKSSK